MAGPRSPFQETILGVSDREVFAKEYRPSDLPAALGWVASGLTRDEAMRMPGATPAMWQLARFFVWRFDRAEARTFGARP